MMGKKRTVWKNDKWQFDVYELMKPDGERVETAAIRHPGAVMLVPLDAQGNVLMIKQYRLPLDQTILEVPAGTRDSKQEEWRSCAQRELREETGFRADKLIDLGVMWPMPSTSDEELRLFLATGLTHDPLPQDFDEEIEVVPMPLTDLCQMALDGRMQDMKSCAALLRVNTYLSLSKANAKADA